MEKTKGVIWYIAARPCLKKNLELLYKNFNNKYQYPVLITTLGKQYSERFINSVRKIDSSIKFIEVPKPEFPSYIKEEELFYNRKEIEYVKKSFPESRKNYLHMCNFVAGKIMNHPEMSQYDYVLKMDDDTFFVKPIEFDIFKFMKDGGYRLGSSTVKKQDSKRQKDCQIGLRELVKNYIKSNNIDPANKVALDKKGDWNNVCTYYPSIWDLNIFRNENWKKWWSYVDESGGIYKHRWGDLEIHSLYVAMYYPASAWYNFNFYAEGITIHADYGTIHQNLFKRILWRIKKLLN